MFEVGNYDNERAVQERPHSKTSSHAGTSVGSSHSTNSLSLNWRDPRPPRDDNNSGSGNGYTRLLLIDRRQKTEDSNMCLK